MTVLLLLALGCGRREVPPHLRLDPPTAATAAPTPPPTTMSEAVTQLVGADPLARRADPGPAGQWDAVPGAEPLTAWARLARQPDARASDWWALERSHAASVAVPLSRGARLAALEIALADARDEQAHRIAMGWLGPVTLDATPLPLESLAPLAWLGGDPRASALVVAERGVLLGWLASPTIPTGSAADALAPGVHDRLIDSDAGRLLQARAHNGRDPDRAVKGRASLRQATELALMHAGADRDGEQAAYRTRLDAARQNADDTDPIARLLTNALADLTADAGDDASLASALVALQATRLHGSCTTPPCGGLDRLSGLNTADQWAPSSEAALWRVIALKRVLDTLDVARDRPSFSAALGDIGDVLVGLGGNPVPERLLRARHPDPAVWLATSRGAGGGDGTSWEDARGALSALLVKTCALALETTLSEDEQQQVQRIQRRAAG
jgi:hypothetical protein